MVNALDGSGDDFRDANLREVQQHALLTGNAYLDVERGRWRVPLSFDEPPKPRPKPERVRPDRPLYVVVDEAAGLDHVYVPGMNAQGWADEVRDDVMAALPFVDDDGWLLSPPIPSVKP